jgi:propanol-preferring alcohol dehydrogenase
VGFGASAHIAIQIATHWGCEVYVFTRSEGHRNLARTLGAAWVGGSEDEPPQPLDRAVLFAPVGDLVPVTLEKLRPGGTLAINAIHLTPIPKMEYRLIYGERTLRSVANATYRDGIELLKLAVDIPIQTTVKDYPLAQANQALLDLKHSRIDGAGVLLP